MSESPVNPRAADLALVAEKFPTEFAILETPYYRADHQGGKAPLGTTRMLVHTVWTDVNGVVRARVSHPTAGDINLVKSPSAQAPEQHTLNMLRDATLHRIPTEATIRDLVVEVVNRQWNGSLDSISESIASVGALRAEFAALQHRVGTLPGLEAIAKLEAALAAQQTQVQGALKQVQGLASEIQAKVDGRLKAVDQEVRGLHIRINQINALLETLLQPSAPEPAPVPAPVVEVVAQPVVETVAEQPVMEVPIDLSAQRSPREILADMNYGALRGYAKAHGLKMPPVGTSLVDTRTYLLRQIEE